jgi:hypothetical protein
MVTTAKTDGYAWITNGRDPRLKEPSGRLDPLIVNRAKFSEKEQKGVAVQRAEAIKAFNTLRGRAQKFKLADVRAQMARGRTQQASNQAHTEAIEVMLKLSDRELATLLVALVPPPAFAVVGGIRLFFDDPAAADVGKAVIGAGADPGAQKETENAFKQPPAYTGGPPTGVGVKDALAGAPAPVKWGLVGTAVVLGLGLLLAWRK